MAAMQTFIQDVLRLSTKRCGKGFEAEVSTLLSSNENALKALDDVICGSTIIEFFGFVEGNQIDLCPNAIQEADETPRIFSRIGDVLQQYIFKCYALPML